MTDAQLAALNWFRARGSPASATPTASTRGPAS